MAGKKEKNGVQCNEDDENDENVEGGGRWVVPTMALLGCGRSKKQRRCGVTLQLGIRFINLVAVALQASSGFCMGGHQVIRLVSHLWRAQVKAFILSQVTQMDT